MYVIKKLKSNYLLCLFLISSFLHLFPAFQHSLWKSALCFFIYHSIPLSPCSSVFSLLTHLHYLSISSPLLPLAAPLSLSFPCSNSHSPKTHSPSISSPPLLFIPPLLCLNRPLECCDGLTQDEDLNRSWLIYHRLNLADSSISGIGVIFIIITEVITVDW